MSRQERDGVVPCGKDMCHRAEKLTRGCDVTMVGTVPLSGAEREVQREKGEKRGAAGPRSYRR